MKLFKDIFNHYKEKNRKEKGDKNIHKHLQEALDRVQVGGITIGRPEIPDNQVGQARIGSRTIYK